MPTCGKPDTPTAPSSRCTSTSSSPAWPPCRPYRAWTAVLDFVNDPEQVLADFQKYYRGCTLQTDADLISYAEGIRDEVIEDPEVALQARNNPSLDQFANGKIKQAIPTAVWEMRSAHEAMTQQVMADAETMKRFAGIVTRMVYEALNEGVG